jgi:hypothetical protein
MAERGLPIHSIQCRVEPPLAGDGRVDGSISPAVGLDIQLLPWPLIRQCLRFTKLELRSTCSPA